jgi:hemerythrin-like domain-containing protein
MSVKPTDILMGEHKVIETVLAAMRRYADALQSGATVDSRGLEGLVPFMREFADAYHHAKEEHRLFPLLVERGLPASNGPVQVMCAEHQIGRDLVGQLERAIERHLGEPAQPANELPDALRAIADFYTQHIRKENNVLFPMADRILSDDDAATLVTAFEEAAGPGGRQLRERFAHFADSLV